ncbi:MAG: hypothetical protein EDM74_01160 [Armatimonadetes bacterium]|nr:MAG: hypothetical protein EDM74_01160 [Armatimonadota bacterium]
MDVLLSLLCAVSFAGPRSGPASFETTPKLLTQAQTSGTLAWKRKSLEELQMSVELPVAPEKIRLELNSATMRQISQVQSYKAVVDEVLFRFTFVTYAAGAEVDLQRASDGAISNLRGTSGVTELKYKTERTKVSALEALRIEATYQFRASPVSYIAVIVGDGQRLWQASAMYRTASASQEQTAKRVMASVTISKE